jgi:NTP pyrophosphatase (non-canonical NTP hydrolase)
LELNDYQQKTRQTAIYSDSGTKSYTAINYTTLGLVGEAGELANVWKKALRDGDFAGARERMRYELGDVLWYLARLGDELGMKLEEVAQCNIDKLKDRKARNRLGGSGEDR